MSDHVGIEPTLEEQLRRADELLRLWPTTGWCFGCENCGKMFRGAEDESCPFCVSVAIWNVSDFLNGLDSKMVPKAMLEARVKAFTASQRAENREDSSSDGRR